MMNIVNNITDLFIHEILEISKKEIPTHIKHQVKRCTLDYLGVTYAGATTQKEKLNAFLKSCSSNGRCSVIGFNKKTDLYTAAFINGFSAHTVELDDGHRFGMLHLEAPIISAVLAIAQSENISAEQFYKAVVIGYEAAVRLAMAIQPIHKQHGFHATGTCGSIGVACAIGVALELDEIQMRSVISAAATSAAGLLEVIDDSSQLKPYNVANAVVSGITAAYMGKAGFIGPNDVLGGKRGFFLSLNGSFKENQLLNIDDYAIEKIYVKPYAACRHCHSAIECALKIKNQSKLNVEEIDRIEVETYKLAVFGHDHTEILGENSAKMSIPFSVAISLMYGDAGISSFSGEKIVDDCVLSLCKKVVVSENSELTKACPEKRGAIVKVYMNYGMVFQEEVEYPLGEPENNINDKELENKFVSLLTFSDVSQNHISKLLNVVWNVENQFSELLNLI